MWDLVQNPVQRADAAKEHKETTSITTARWSSFKRQVIAVLVILFSLIVLTAAFYLVIGPLMIQMTQKPETTRFVLATRHGQDEEQRPERRFAKPWGRLHHGAVELDGCVRSFANCSSATAAGWSTAYRCVRPGMCEPWKAEEHCLAGGARFDTMNKCRRSCHNGDSCTVAEACPCRGDYRTANYVHRADRGCRRLADHRCLVQPAQGFSTLAHCRRECGAQGHTTGQPSARCGSTASTRPCGWEDRQHRAFWDGHECRPWDASVCPPDVHPDRKACREQCVERAEHSAAAVTKAQSIEDHAATGKPFSTRISSRPTTPALPSPQTN